jgi:hypothetical protein
MIAGPSGHAIHQMVCLLQLRSGGAAPVDVGTRNQVIVDHGVKRADTLVQFLGDISKLGGDCAIPFCYRHSSPPSARLSLAAAFFREKYSRTDGPEIGGGDITKPSGPLSTLSRFICSMNCRCDLDSALLLCSLICIYPSGDVAAQQLSTEAARLSNKWATSRASRSWLSAIRESNRRVNAVSSAPLFDGFGFGLLQNIATSHQFKIHGARPIRIATVGLDVKSEFLSDGENGDAGRLSVGNMDEAILLSVVARNKTEATFRFEYFKDS